MTRNRLKVRRRFQVMHLRKLVVLRRIIGSHRVTDLTPAEREDVGEILRMLDAAIEAHEQIMGVKLAAE